MIQLQLLTEQKASGNIFPRQISLSYKEKSHVYVCLNKTFVHTLDSLFCLWNQELFWAKHLFFPGDQSQCIVFRNSIWRLCKRPRSQDQDEAHPFDFCVKVKYIL